jgi:hypothetical protein
MPLKTIVALVTLLFFMAVGSYYYFLYPPALYERATQKTFDDISKIVATKDRTKISDALKSFITDDAHIKLEVTFFSVFQQNNPVAVQEFEKQSFISFIDNILYSMQDYAFSAQINEFNLSPDHKSATIILHSEPWADGTSYYSSNSMNVRFSADTTCTAKIVFEGKQVLLDNLTCKLRLATLPKSGQEDKLRDPEILKGLMR